VTKTRGCLWLSAGCATAIVLSLVVARVVLRSTFRPVRYTNTSMHPTLAKGDALFTRPATEIRRGDLVMYAPLNDRDRYLHRVVALPGETVAMRDDVVYVNGAPLDEPYAWIDEKERPASVRNVEPLQLPADHFFILGDNRDNSNDSRYLGPIARETIQRRVVFVLSKENGPWKP
jgi:signal peptidase I